MKTSIFLLILALFFLSCENQKVVNKEFPKQSCYFLYRPIKEIYDSTKDILVGYEIIDKKPSIAEQDSIISILKEFNWQFKLTENRELLISIYSMKNMDDLYLLQSELDKRVNRN